MKQVCILYIHIIIIIFYNFTFRRLLMIMTAPVIGVLSLYAGIRITDGVLSPDHLLFDGLHCILPAPASHHQQQGDADDEQQQQNNNKGKQHRHHDQSNGVSDILVRVLSVCDPYQLLSLTTANEMSLLTSFDDGDDDAKLS